MSDEIEVVDRRRVVVAALPLDQQAREHLESQLDGARVVDIRMTVERADLVLAPSCSPQTVAALKDAYPDARLVVVEIEDWEFGIDLPGPVKRLLDAGADGYLTADSVDDLAGQLSPGRTPHRAESAPPEELPTPSIDDVIVGALRERLSGSTAHERDEVGRGDT